MVTSVPGMDISKLLAPPSPPTRSTSPAATRQPSRSPRPYRRSTLPSSTQHFSAASSFRNAAYLPSPLPTPGNSRAPSPLLGGRRRRKTTGRLSTGGSESGTEADDELTRRLPAPPGKRKRTLSEEDEYYGEEEEVDDDFDGRGRRMKRRMDAEDGDGKRKRRKGIVFVRRGIEVGLMGILVGVVLYNGGEDVVWREAILWKIEFACWMLVFASVVLLYPLRILLRKAFLELPRSLDPSPLLYPTLFPVLVSLSLTQPGAASRNPYILTNIILSLSALPPGFFSSQDLHWALSLAPVVISSYFKPELASRGDTLSFLPPIQFALVSILNYLIQPSLTQTEIRLISSALVNLFLHAASPQSTILKAILWGGGLGVLVTCGETVKWSTDLARVPSSRLRRAGHAIISIGRFRALAASLKLKGQASDSEGEIGPLVPTQKAKPSTRPRAKSQSKMSFYTSLTPTQIRTRKWGYALAVYGSIIGIVMLGLRPYIAAKALDGLDPFIWAPAYLFCGQSWYQDIIDTLAPGTGYCITAGSGPAANLRIRIIGYWLLILAMGISLVTALLPHVQVDTRRKVFHGMVVAMFLIPGVLDPQFTHLCLSLALAAFLLLDMVRAGQLPPASGSIARFLQPFVDGRDLKGPVVVSHVFLLLGCGAGWWLTLAAAPGADVVDGDGWNWGSRRTDLSFVSGVVSVGLGDAAASLVGRRFGRTKWGWRGGKSLEGSAAFTIAVAAGLVVGRWWIGGTGWGVGVLAKIVAVGAWGSMVEAVVTGVNDNVVVPVGAWAVVRGLGL